MTKYTAVIQETKDDWVMFQRNGVNLQLAKSVSEGGGAATYNVGYKSTFPEQNMEMQWKASYALNWTTAVPALGAAVTTNGDWQQCAPGASYDLTEQGAWTANQNNTNASENGLNVAVNRHSTPVFVVIGTEDVYGGWVPIWVGNSALAQNGHGEYQPLESIRLWYQSGDTTGTMVDSQAYEFQEYAMTKPRYYFSYDVFQGQWRTPQPYAFYP